ncbi:solute carrier family 25 member 40-like isoform X3 [Stegodyphus dumicola]|uniref:solute carrier family 25 member 40-like isoform X3 n=1 Tax=Stegodyphus dumicola TaxID=202533 RepID=UPI0015AAA07F|nr:solute carrier family 25 member 40-like isoform X3 [Stegodyphus dumicola]
MSIVRGEDVSLTVSEQVLSACAGALVTSLFVTPLDVVKIRLQVQEKVGPGKKCFQHYSCLWDNLCYCIQEHGCKRCEWYKTERQFKGTLDAFMKISKYEGITSLWSGLSPTLVMAIPATVIYFTMYEQIRDNTMKTLVPPLHPYWVPMMSGISARDVYKSLVQLVKQRGLISLWHGWVPTLLRDVPFSAIYWSIYEHLKLLKPEPSFTHSFVFGALSGTVAAAFTTPFDVIKTHRQAQLGEAALLHKAVKTSTFSLIMTLYRQGKTKSLLAGLLPRIMKVAPSCAIMISSYEFGKSYFKKRRAKAKD